MTWSDEQAKRLGSPIYLAPVTGFAFTRHAPIIASGDSVPADVPAEEGSDPTVDVMASPAEASGGDE